MKPKSDWMQRTTVVILTIFLVSLAPTRSLASVPPSAISIHQPSIDGEPQPPSIDASKGTATRFADGSIRLDAGAGAELGRALFYCQEVYPQKYRAYLDTQLQFCQKRIESVTRLAELAKEEEIAAVKASQPSWWDTVLWVGGGVLIGFAGGFVAGVLVAQ